MTEAVARLVARLAALSDAERFAFALWAHERRAPSVRRADLHGNTLARAAAEGEATAGFARIVRDGTWPEGGWMFEADPFSPLPPGAWDSAIEYVRAMAAALELDDVGGLAALSPAFGWLGLSPLTAVSDGRE